MSTRLGMSIQQREVTMGEKAFLVTALILASEAFLSILLGFDYLPGAGMGSLMMNTIWAIVFIVTYILLRRRGVSIPGELRKSPYLGLILAMPFLSVLWSANPTITLLASVALTGSALIALYLSLFFTSRELLRLLVWTMGIMGMLSVVWAICIPSLGIGTGEFEGQWLGIFSQKNVLGRMMSIGFLAALLLFKFTRGRRFQYLAFAGFMLALVCLAQSATSLVFCLGLPLIWWFTKYVLTPAPKMIWRRVILGAFGACIVWVLVIDFDQVVLALGRDEGLTGRTTLWTLVIGAVGLHPLLGYGYEGFWRGSGAGGIPDEIWEKFGQFLWFSHSGLLELLLAFGLIGAAVVLGVCLVLVGRSIARLRRAFVLETAWPYLFLIYLIIMNATDDYILNMHTLQTILFFTIILGVRHDSAIKLPRMSMPTGIGG